MYLSVLIRAASLCACINTCVVGQGQAGKLAGMKNNSAKEGCGRSEGLEGAGKLGGCFQQQQWLMLV